MRIRTGTLVLALFMAMAGCAVTDDSEGDRSSEATAAASSAPTFQLTVTSAGSDTVVSSAGGVNTCPMTSTCSFAYAVGTALSIDVTTIFSPLNDCLRFVRWTGACAGQGRPCSATITDRNLTVSSTWQLRPHCIPD